MTGAQVLVQSLKDIGVSCVFGYTGASILPVIDELAKTDIRFVVSSNEQAAAFGASGYSRSSSGFGVAIVTSGPAVTNTLTAVSDANADSIPLIVIAGQVPEYKIGTDSFQHINVSGVFAAAAKKVVLIDDIAKVETIVKDAWALAKSGKPGPVVIDVPLNLQRGDCPYEALPPERFLRAYERESHLSEAQCETFFALLAGAERPLLYLGGGLVQDASVRAVRAFRERFPIPAVNTLMGKGTVNERDEDVLGLLGMFGTPAANKIIQENDLFIAIGVRWDDRVAEKVGFALKSKIAYIDIHHDKVSQIRLERTPEFSAVGDAAHILADLVAYAERKEFRREWPAWRKRAVQLKKAWPLDFDRKNPIIQQAHALEILDKAMPENAIITTGVGNHQLLAAQYLKMSTTRRFLTSGSFGTMGFGMPNAVGAAWANPDATVIVVDGDGSFRMNLGELYTIGTQRLNVKILLLNNMSDGMVRNLETAAYEDRHSATDRDVDVRFADLAKVCGFAWSERVEKTEELEGAIRNLLAASGPAMLEVMTDREEVLYPVVPVGKGYHEMDLGPFIREIAVDAQ